MSRALFLAFSSPEGVVPRDAARLWRVDVPTPLPSAERGLELATGAAWGVTGNEIVAVPEDGCTGADTIGDVTIAIACAVDLDAMGASAVCLVSHDPEAGESVLWTLGLHIMDPTRRLVRLFMQWRRANPADPPIYLDGPAFVMPEGTVLLMASRERTAAGYVGRFAVNGRAGGQSSADLVIGDLPAELGNVRVMCAPATETLDWPVGHVEFVDVQLRAAALEELELVGRRFAEITPKVEAAFRRYAGGPMRDVWSQDPTSIVQRELRVQAGVLAYARAELEVVGRYAGPLTSFGELLERWEEICKMPPRAGDGIDDRRARLATHLALDGNSIEDICAALAEPLGLAANLIGIEETTSITFEDDFDPRVDDVDGYRASGHDAEAWIRGNATSNGGQFTFTNDYLGGGTFRINRTLSTDDLRWWGRTLQVNYAPPQDAHPPFLLHATAEGGVDTVWQTRLEALTVPADNILAGLIIGDLEADDWTWIGVVRIGGAFFVESARRIGEDLRVVTTSRHRVGPTAWDGIGGIVGGSFAATSLRVRQLDLTGRWEVRYWTGTDPGDDWSAADPVTLTTCTPRPRYGGLGVVGLSSAATGAFSAQWGYFKERSPHAPHALTWHAYRNPDEAGAYDLVAAQAVLDRYGPAHADATAIDRIRSLVYTDATTLLDRDPIGT